MTKSVRDYLLFEHLLTHHVPSHRDAIVKSGTRGLVLMPSIAAEIMQDYGALVEVPYIYVRVWIFEDGWNGQSADSWLAILDERIPQWRDLCQAANELDKKIGFIITNEVGGTAGIDDDFIRGFSDFTVEVLDRLAEVPGAYGVIGNRAMGTIDQGWFDVFMTDAMVERIQEGKAIFGIHEYGHVHPAGLMRYTADGQEYNFLAGSYMPESWPPPVPTPEQIREGEAHLLGRFVAYVNVPRWLPWVLMESWIDAVSLQQALDWGAPVRDFGGGDVETFGGVRTLLGFFGTHWGARNPARFYVEQYGRWVEAFYRQWGNCYGVAHFATGDDYGNFEDFDIDSTNGGGDFLRADIGNAPMSEEIAPWNWARFVLAHEPPAPEPPHTPPEPIDVYYTKAREGHRGTIDPILLETIRRQGEIVREARKHGWDI